MWLPDTEQVTGRHGAASADEAERHCATPPPPRPAGAFVFRWCSECSLARAIRQSPHLAGVSTLHFLSTPLLFSKDIHRGTVIFTVSSIDFALLYFLLRKSVAGGQLTRKRREKRDMKKLHSATRLCYKLWGTNRLCSAPRLHLIQTHSGALLLYELLFIQHAPTLGQKYGRKKWKDRGQEVRDDEDEAACKLT